MRNRRNSTENGSDPRLMPSYSISEAAHYLQIPQATLRSWVRGRFYPVHGGRRFFKPVIKLPTREAACLSFVNLVEAHVLDSIRRKFEIPLPKVRVAVGFLSRHFDSSHPLAEHRMETDGKDLFVVKFGQLINVSGAGQLAIREILEAYLKRIEWDQQGLASRLFLFTRKRTLDEPKTIFIDSRVAFGRPALIGTGIATAVIAGRYKAGESIPDLAEDYNRTASEIEEAIRCELFLDAA